MYISVNSSEKLLSEEESNILYSFEAFNSVKQAHPSFSLLFFLFIIGIVQIICSGVGGLFTANDIKFFCSLCRRHRYTYTNTSRTDDVEHYCTHSKFKINTEKTKTGEYFIQCLLSFFLPLNLRLLTSSNT